MAELTGERRLFMNFGAPVTTVPVGEPGDYFAGAQLVAVGGNIVRQGGDAGSAFAGFVRRTRRAALAGDMLSVVSPTRVWLPLAGAAHGSLYAVVYSAIDDQTITLDATAAGATAMGLIRTVEPLRGEVLVDMRASIPGVAAGGVQPVQPVTPVAYTRWFGMSPDRIIETADFAAANDSQSNQGAFPGNAADAYPWFAVPADRGVPTAIYRPPNPANQIHAFTRQPGTVDDPAGDPQIVMVANASVPPRAAERAARIG